MTDFSDIGKAGAYIIAEIGVNHNGDPELGARMIREAKACGADAVKFQTWITEENTSRRAQKAEYQKRGEPGTDSMFDMLKRLELSYDDYVMLKRCAEDAGIDFFSRASSPGALDMLVRLDVPFIKIGSPDITYHQIIRDIARTQKPILLSTGASTLGEVEEALATIYATGNRQVLLFHCTTNYPTRMEDVNLRAMVTLRRAFGLPVGYSDHTLGHEVSVAAVALGAVSIERHFTLDKGLPGPDHQASLDPAEFRAMVAAIRNVETALGDGIKAVRPCEQEMLIRMRRSVTARRTIAKGEKIAADMLCIKRPAGGVAPRDFDMLVGRTALADIPEDAVITWDML